VKYRKKYEAIRINLGWKKQRFKNKLYPLEKDEGLTSYKYIEAGTEEKVITVSHLNNITPKVGSIPNENPGEEERSDDEARSDQNLLLLSKIP
jgi:hypothetical protein